MKFAVTAKLLVYSTMYEDGTEMYLEFHLEYQNHIDSNEQPLGLP